MIQSSRISRVFNKCVHYICKKKNASRVQFAKTYNNRREKTIFVRMNNILAQSLITLVKSLNKTLNVSFPKFCPRTRFVYYNTRYTRV